MIKIEKNIPIPEHRSKYPVADMKVGDSFLVEDFSQRGTVVTIMCRCTKEHPDRKFATRQVDGGYRCWRTE